MEQDGDMCVVGNYSVYRAKVGHEYKNGSFWGRALRGSARGRFVSDGEFFFHVVSVVVSGEGSDLGDS